MNARELGAAMRIPKAAADERSAELARSLAPSAAGRGWLDVAVGEVNSPLGSLLVAVTPRGLARVAFADENRNDVLNELAAELSPRVLESREATQRVRRELDEYFAGERRRFDVRVDWSLVHGIATQTLRATARVPYGGRTTYRDLARSIGNPKASRAIGNALGSNPVPIVVPCHRVLRSDGTLGGYAGGLRRKRALLRLEGALP